ncbi:MAG: NAD-dependent dehydratase [Sphingopyxis sp.]|nr:MAG: NAD-dependent dehydratase [Sphingopyxis sp.]
MTTKTKAAATSDAAPKSAERKGRLEGKVALVTGAAGNLGSHIVRHYVREGAKVIMTGRTRDRIEAARGAVINDMGVAEDQLATVTLDGADPKSVRSGMAKALKAFGRLDILVNNAGSAGPKQTLENVPLSAADLEANREAGATDTETVGDAMRNILAVTWNLAREAAPHMQAGGTIINVSTIFSHTRYYGRTAYVVPKAALNSLSEQLAKELGPSGIRVNTIFPGPIESDRIRTVFAAMDDIQGNKEGTTADHFMGRMSLVRSMDGAKKGKSLPTPPDIAQTCVFLGSDESAAFNGQEFDVTHGMAVNKNSQSTYLARPSMRSLDGTGLSVLIAAGEQWEDALEFAKVQTTCGAEVMLGLERQADVAQARARVKALDREQGLTIVRFNRSDPEGMEAALEEFSQQHPSITSAIFLPVKAANHFQGRLIDVSDKHLNDFIDTELTGTIALGRTLSRYWKKHDDLVQEPRFVFISNGSDGQGDRFHKVLSAAATQLVTIWRDESRVDQEQGKLNQPAWGNQIIRYSNEEEENINFTAGQATRIVCKKHKIQENTLYLPTSIGEATGARKAMVGFAENITGLHLGKVALITGGSAGIGGQVARLLALAGCKVMMVARRESELNAARDRIIGELQDVGFSGVERRVEILPDIDVSDFESLKKAVEVTMAKFGQVDYLINNAGVAGAEDMVVDMDIDAWRWTLDANLVSNFLLMHELVPHMKKRGSGYVLNVSSYFGGEKFLAVAYPNRSDYAVSKAGQRAMVESFSEYLGPEVQLNAIAPGPVDGDRLSGVGGKPGLFQRRAKLILENKRLNAVYAAVVKSIRDGVSVEHVLGRLARNDAAYMSHDEESPKHLRELALECAKEGDGICTWDRFLLTKAIAASLLARLGRGGYLLGNDKLTEQCAANDGEWLSFAPSDDATFLPEEKVNKMAAGVGKGVLSQLHLGRMPTETEVAQATVFFLADRAVSGETFMPSGGLSVQRSATERELFGSPKQDRLDRMRGKTVWFVGEHLADYKAEAIKQMVVDHKVERVVLLVGSKTGGKMLVDRLPEEARKAVEILYAADEIEDGMDQALAKWGRPTIVVSTPQTELPNRLFDEGAMLSPNEFRDIVEQNLTQHFRVARKASLYDDCQLVLVSPDVPLGTDGPAFALANFIKTTLHAFTATLAVENERLVHDVPINQINLTRRVRSEEPTNEEEHEEELKRFARAVLLVGAPLPDAEDSRYRARIYRGTSMTV